MDKEAAKKRIVTTLRAIASGEETPPCDEGLCIVLMLTVGANPYYTPSKIASIVTEAALTWEHFSGIKKYPVPDPEGLLTSARIYNKAICYEGRYGELRRDLARHIADYLENDNGNTSV